MKKIFRNFENGQRLVSFNSKFGLTLLSALFFSVVTGCSAVNISSAGNTPAANTDIASISFNQALQSLNLAPGENLAVIDFGNGNPGSSIAVKLNLADAFKTKASTGGFNGTFTNVNSFKIAMVTNSAGSLNLLAGTSVLSITKGQLISDGNLVTDNSPSPSVAQVILKSVPAGPTIFVAVAALDVSGNNQTNAAPTIAGQTGNFAVSSSSVAVSSTFSVSPTTALTVPLNLLTQGATFDTLVNVTNGNTTLPATVILFP
jgi:hypothetical protein